MNESEFIAMCLVVRKKKFEQSQALIARCRKNVEQSELKLADAREQYDIFKNYAPELHTRLYKDIQGKPLNYFELDTYFAELGQISMAEANLEEVSMVLEKSVKNAQSELNEHLYVLQKIRKKYEKMQKIEEVIVSEEKQKAVIRHENDMDDIALTIRQTGTQYEL